MEEDSVNSGRFILGLILSTLGGLVIREIIKDYAFSQDSSDSDSPEPKNITKVEAPKLEAPLLRKQITLKKDRVINVRKIVKSNLLPYHLEKGWEKEGIFYQGYYRCKLAAFRGEIEERFNGDYKFYIFNPPEEILSGPHAPCFTRAGDNRYHVHFGVNSRSLDSGIMAIERILYQTLNRR